jgi:Zn-dependent protease with chaperone function
MPPVSDSSSNLNSRSVADAEAGLAALKQGDYPRAIALLETTTLPPSNPLSGKAQMGLVVAYTRNGNPQQAVTVCRALSQNKSPQIREWATRTLENLAKRYPQIPGLAEFVQEAEMEGYGNTETGADKDAITQKRETVARKKEFGFVANPTDLDNETDLTGFVAFDGASEPDQGVEADVTGFAPYVLSESSADLELEESGQRAAEKGERGRREESSGQRAVVEPAQALSFNPRAKVSPEMPPREEPAYHPSWRQAERAKNWKPVGKIDVALLISTQVVTAIALFWVMQKLVYLSMLTPLRVLGAIPFLKVRYVLFDPPVWPILIFLAVLFIASRWLLDALLTIIYGLQPLSLSKLGNYSPETVQSLNRFCRQRRLPMPALGILPTAAPVSFSYGCIPQVTRLVVSQGLLDQLADDEIAAIYASEIGHIGYWDVPLMSLMMAVIQIPYTVYQLVAEWGNRQSAPVLRVLASWVASLSYGLYWLLRWIGLWLSRQRTYNSDRVSANLTGNPNGLTRALLKIAIGTAKEVEQQGQTSYLLEGFDLMTPLGHHLATPLGSVYPHVPLKAVLAWDLTNPYRHWLSISNSHPPTGDRLHRLASYARQWRLGTELDLDQSQQSPVRQRQSVLTSQQWRTLLLQGAPFVGLGFGLALAFSLSLIGWVGLRLNLNQISWLYGDPTVLRGLPLIGFSLGTFIRINPFFPDIKLPAARTPESSPLVGFLKDPATVPVDSLPVRLEGKLLGRPGISNVLSQDLLLQTSTGLVWLHCFSPLGPLGNLLFQDVRFTDFIQQEIAATGWFRRGATFWIDVDTLRTAGGRTSRSNHPLWSTILAVVTATLGIYTIFRGGG